MLTKDLKTIIDLMELTNKKYACVKIKDCKAYSTNGGAIAVRPVSINADGYIDKHFLPKLKGIYSVNKANEYLDESIENLIIETWEGFPTFNEEALFDRDFKYEIRFDADLLTKMIKALKGKDNKVIMKIVGNNDPFMIMHENGKGMIAPVLN